MTESRTKENRLRAGLLRRRLQLQKSRRRDEKAPDFGRYRIVDPSTNTAVAGGTPFDFTMSLEDVEAWMKD